MMAAVVLLAVLQSAAPTSGVEDSQLSEHDANILRRFDALPEEEQARIAEELRENLYGVQNPICRQAAAAHQRHPENTRKSGLIAYSASVYTPNWKLDERHHLASGKTWKRLEKRFFPKGFVDRSMLWDWDYSRDRMLSPKQPMEPREVVICLLYGWWPSDESIQALAEGSLDRDDTLDRSADYFQHAYRDRNGQTYQGVSIFDVWNSGRTFGISDADALAWMDRVEEKDGPEPPLSKRERDPIYRSIEASFTAFRDYRLLRRALAARMWDPNGRIEPRLEGMADTLDQAWIWAAHDPEVIAGLLQEHPTRQAFFAALREILPPAGSLPDIPHWEEHQMARADLPWQIRQSTLDYLADEGLLGFHRRGH